MLRPGAHPHPLTRGPVTAAAAADQTLKARGPPRRSGCARSSETSMAGSAARATKATLRPVSLGVLKVTQERRPDGALLIRSTAELGGYPEKLTKRLEHWAAAAPERIFLAQRDGRGAWRTLTYAQALHYVGHIGGC